jgi:pyridinium-3,5-biscarboxylic acid mononucleotide sulfurtransferase
MTQAAPMETLEPGLRAKGEKLLRLLSDMESLVVAYSGGVDSGLLCAAAHQALGDRLLAVTVRSPVETPGDHAAAAALAEQVGFRHMVVDFDDLANPRFTQNPPDRCYHCKLARFQAVQQIARREGFRWIAEGSNVDDADDYRPGAKAVMELGVRSPLAEAGLTKTEIRALARSMGLIVWNRPSAPCLATRFPYGSEITVEGLAQVAAGEAFLREQGFGVMRVRHFGDTARIEVPAQSMAQLVDLREDLLAFFKQAGFTYVMLDLAGYRSGSMNEVLTS